MKEHESREVKRYELPSELSVVYEGAAEVIPIRPADLSSRACSSIPKPFPEGSILKVRFRLCRVDFVVNVRAEVRHCVPASDSESNSALEPEALLAIEQELRVPDSTGVG
jgi:hypothetical protein